MPFIILVGVVLLQLSTPTSVKARTDLLLAEADRGAGGTVENSSGAADRMEISTIVPEITLSEAIETALSDSYVVQQAGEAVEMIKAAGRAGLTVFLPELSTVYSYTRLQDTPTVNVPGVGEFETGSVDTFRLGVTFRYPLFVGGEHEARRVVDAEAGVTEIGIEEAKAAIRVGVTAAYTYVLEAEAGLEAARISLQHLEELHRNAQAHYDAGYLPLSDLLSVRVARASAQQRVSEMARNVELARSALAYTMGMDISRRFGLAPVGYPEVDVPFSLETLWDWAQSERPEMREVLAKRDALELQIRAWRLTRLPRLYFQADWSKSGSDIGFGGDGLGSGAQAQAMLTLTWDIWDFGRSEDEAAPARAELAMLDIREAELRSRIKQEVEQSLLNLKTQLGNLQVSREAVAQAEEAFRVARRRQEEGLGLTVEVLDAEARLAETSAGYYHILYEYYRSLASLAQAVGTTTDDLVTLIIAAGEEEQ